jgi:pilus assembly protein CpaC
MSHDFPIYGPTIISRRKRAGMALVWCLTLISSLLGLSKTAAQELKTSQAELPLSLRTGTSLGNIPGIGPGVLPNIPRIGTVELIDPNAVGAMVQTQGELPKVPVVQLPEKGKEPGFETVPMPRSVDMLFGPNRSRLARLGESVGQTPMPTPQDLKELGRFVGGFVDPKYTLDLVQGRTRSMKLKFAPKRVQVADESIVMYNLLDPTEVTLMGKNAGTTVLNLWFEDPDEKNKQRIISYHVRVVPDPEARVRLEKVYQALEKEINATFPNSVVSLKLVGDKLAISGQAHDIADATQILRIVRANAPNDDSVRQTGGTKTSESIAVTGVPGLEDFQHLGGPSVINLMRIPGEQQVMLRVTVAEVNRTAARSIGMNFSITNKAGLTVFENRTGNIATGGQAAVFGGAFNNINGLANNLAGLATNNLPVALDNGQVRLAINALRSLNYARSLAEPNLVALNGQTATFRAGGQFPVPIISGYTAAGLQGVNFVPYGVQLNFTPFITDRDRVRLNINASISTRDINSGTNIAGSFVSGLNSRDFQTTVELREGQTLAIAGLIQNNLGADASRIPFFGDIPILNRFAGFDRVSAGEQELVVLISPELVHPMNAKEIPPLPGSDLFEPSDLEFYLLGRLESLRGHDYRSPVMNDPARMRRYHRCDQIHIFGPNGYSPHP